MPPVADAQVGVAAEREGREGRGAGRPVAGAGERIDHTAVEGHEIGVLEDAPGDESLLRLVEDVVAGDGAVVSEAACQEGQGADVVVLDPGARRLASRQPVDVPVEPEGRHRRLHHGVELALARDLEGRQAEGRHRPGGSTGVVVQAGRLRPPRDRPGIVRNESRPAVLVHVQDHVDPVVAGPPDHLGNPIQIGGVIASWRRLEQAPGEAQLDHVEAEVPHLTEVVLADRRGPNLRRVGRAGPPVVGRIDRKVGLGRSVAPVRAAPEVDEPGDDGASQDSVSTRLVCDVGAPTGRVLDVKPRQVVSGRPGFPRGRHPAVESDSA